MRSPAAGQVGRATALALIFLLLVLSPASVQARVRPLPFAGSHKALQAAVGEMWDPDLHRPPPTGRAQLRRGGTLLALGLLRSTTAILHIIFSAPDRCGPEKRLDWSRQSCRNLKIYGIAGLGLSAAFLLGGSWELSRGIRLQRKHRAWKKNHWDHFSGLVGGGGPADNGVHPGPRSF